MAGPIASGIRAAVDLYGAGRFVDAAAACRAALATEPGNPNLLNVLALSESQTGGHEAADAILRTALDAAPSDPEVRATLYSSLGYVALRRDAPGPAEAALRAALDLDPAHADANFNLGCVLHASDPTAAEACYRAALAARPTHLGAHHNLGDILLARDDLAGATKIYEKAVAQAPDDIVALRNLAKARRQGGDVMGALKLFDQAVAVGPEDVDAQFGRALTLLLGGDYARGWDAYRWRYRRADNPPRHSGIPEWQGDDPAGRTILVHTEQGFGDAIQFARFAPHLAARGAKVILECPVPLAQLFTSLDGIRVLLVRNHPPPPVDEQIPLLELPRLFDARLNTIPTSPYLRPPRNGPELPAGRHAYRPNVGIVPGTRSRTPGARRKSLPRAAIETIMARRDINFFFMQQDATDDERAASVMAGAVDLTPLMTDFAASAALVAQLDLVVTVDTATAHLAGALGKPVWVLLHAYPDWRWLVDRDDSPWYPSARLFRQPAPGDWPAVARAVAAALPEARP